MQDLRLQGMQQKLQKSRSPSNKNAWHIELNYIYALFHVHDRCLAMVSHQLRHISVKTS